jgi:hypothetical protein
MEREVILVHVPSFLKAYCSPYSGPAAPHSPLLPSLSFLFSSLVLSLLTLQVQVGKLAVKTSFSPHLSGRPSNP